MRHIPLTLAALLLAPCALAQSRPAPGDLSGVKTYLLTRLADQKAGTARLKNAADRYYTLAKGADFDYARLARTNAGAVRAALQGARAGWSVASPRYEEVEGIVAGVESLSEFDLILDAGVSGAEGGEDVVPFDLRLPDGRTLARPGNLFGVNEGALWGTVKSFGTPARLDLDGDGRLGFGDTLPDAQVLKAAAGELDRQTAALVKAASTWTPTQADVFGALVGNVPTVGPVFFDGWKTSRFVLGARSQRRDFVVISRLSDLVGNVASWQAMYAGLSPSVRARNAALDRQISAGLTDLRSFAARLARQEQSRRFTPEQADTLQAEGQNRATAITGRLTQAAALLGVEVQP